MQRMEANFLTQVVMLKISKVDPTHYHGTESSNPLRPSLYLLHMKCALQKVGAIAKPFHNHDTSKIETKYNIGPFLGEVTQVIIDKKFSSASITCNSSFVVATILGQAQHFLDFVTYLTFQQVKIIMMLML